MTGESVPDVAAAMERALVALDLAHSIRPGMRIGIPAGSRGICQIPLLLRVMVEHVRRLGGEPVVVTAMGSHGGGTVEGQLAVLESLGVTASSIGVPVVGNAAAVEIARSVTGEPVWFDQALAGCDGLIVLNRVKSHTSFRGRLESGLTKMLVVGCGKAAGARQFHSLGALQLSDRLREFGQLILERLPVLGGVAVLENGREEIAALEPVRPAGWIASEERLLEEARRLLPRLPVDHLDLLVVDEMGKNYAGTGMDTNVIGRFGIRGVADVGPQIGRIVVLDLSEGSHGNANGMGLADFITRRFADKIDFPATYLNTLTATFVERAKMPIVMESDREAIETALRTLGSPVEPCIIRVRNTLELEHLWVSPAVLAGLRGVAVEGPPLPWRFATGGDLVR